uniref:Uncharacterized protein n=1 Tax=Rhizophagus irregularis (strain DAOM 181602 / DAOM 197198 / MUCL 43194) TaxID=747089 RepID=U9UH47_RHIID
MTNVENHFHMFNMVMMFSNMIVNQQIKNVGHISYYESSNKYSLHAHLGNISHQGKNEGTLIMETNQLILKPAKENEKKIWKFAEWGIKLASMAVPGTIVYMTGFAAIPIGGLMIIGSCYVSGLAGRLPVLVSSFDFCLFLVI